MRKSKTLLDFFKKSSNDLNKSDDGINPTSRNGSTSKDSEEISIKSTDSPSSKRKAEKTSNKSQNLSDNDATSEDETVMQKKPKRRRITVASESDDSSDEYKPAKESESSDTAPSEYSDSSDCEISKKKTKKNVKKDVSSVFSSYSKTSDSAALNVSSDALAKSFQCTTASPKSVSRKSAGSSTQINGISNDKFKYLHERLDWLRPENIRDKNGRQMSHKDYDPDTIYIPESFKKTLTPGLKQWWDIKSTHFNTVLFFKVGKFYEFYHMDAVIGVKELDLSYMKGDFAHAGFPEVAFGKFSDILIQKGYKVARIEQTENPQMMEQRCKTMRQPTKYDRVVKREVCQIASKGTRTTTYDEWCNSIGSNNNFLLAIYEKFVHTTNTNISEYGICFVDTTIGKFTLGQFRDDRHKSRLLSFVGMYPPVEVLLNKSSVSNKTIKLIENNLPGVSVQQLTTSAFCDATQTLKLISESRQLPETILELLDKDDKLFQTPLKEYELGFIALGACIWYLKRCLIDDCLLTMKLFDVYRPTDENTKSCSTANDNRKYMILDNVTLYNLALVPSQSPESETLFGVLNYCETSFGKRELRKWICSPLFQPTEIYDRLNAIDDLKEVSVFDDARKILKKLPDLERLLNKIHIHGLSRNKDHPESRAIFYETEIYNKKKIGDLLTALEGFNDAVKVCALLEEYVPSFKSILLKNCVSTVENKGSFPLLTEFLAFFTEAFDHGKAMKQGSIIPRPGVNDNYDSALKNIDSTVKKLNSYLDLQCKKLNCQVKFVNVGKNRYLLEIPDNKNVSNEYEFLAGRKGFKRYYTKEVRNLLSDLVSSEEKRDLALRDTTRLIFEQFDKHYSHWESAIHCLSTLDVLLSLTNYCKINIENMSRPEFLTDENASEPYLQIKEGRHPLFEKYTDKDFIPNSICIGRKDAPENVNSKGSSVILVTGPNMGGKSTLMRQTGILLVMAHIGCYVPAESMILTPVDRIFTRVGANDQIYKGESTFFVESNETACILHHATSQSFVLIDELGRGTSTYDGTAIAYATANFIANEIRSRTLFSTHYHSLVDDFHDNPNVGLGHMACMVEENKDCPSVEKVTFLYKFVDGACPKSYGFNVALLAGIDKRIVCKGFSKSQQMDYGSRISKLLRKLLTVYSPGDIIDALDQKM